MPHNFAVGRGRAGWVLPCLLVLALGAWLPTAAQGPTLTITRATLNLWPEYDDPGLLVIFAGEFGADVAFPQPVAFPLPAGARGIQAAVPDATGALLSQPWQIVEGKLSYTLPQPQFHTEYYLDRPPAAAQRELTYTFQAPYPIQELEITVQQPARAAGFAMTPQPESSTQGSDGFTYYRLSRSNLAAGDRLDLTLRYTKNDQSPSIAPTRPAPTPAVAQSGVSDAAVPARPLWPWLLIGLGLAALLGTGVYWLVTHQQERDQPAASRRKSPKSVGTPVARPPLTGTAAFCTQCGQPFRPEDRFCAQCGAPRRG